MARAPMGGRGCWPCLAKSGRSSGCPDGSRFQPRARSKMQSVERSGKEAVWVWGEGGGGEPSLLAGVCKPLLAPPRYRPWGRH